MTRIKTLASWVYRCRRLAPVLVVVCVAATRLAAQTPAVPDYQIGDRAVADVVTPVPLLVFDPARTESLRRAEAQKATPIFRYQPSIMREAEGRLHQSFQSTRSRFAEGLEELFGHPLPLLTTEVAQPQFTEFLANFRERNAGFPLSTNLAELWALGDGGELLLDRLRATLRKFTNSFVRPDALPAGERLAPGLVRLVTVDQTNVSLTLVEADRRGRNIARSNMVTVARLRQNVTRNLRGENLAAARFVAGFLDPNCFFDEALTQQARTRRTESINAADRYEAGQTLITQGEIITAPIKLALDELRARTEPDRAQAALALERSKVEAEAVKAREAAQSARQSKRWLMIGLGVSGAVSLMLLAGWLRHRSTTRVAALALTTPDSGEESGWRERAVEAEARAEKATALLKANLLPHLARWMMNGMMQRLLSQRSESQSTQQLAEQEVAELAQRLASLHAPLEERLKAYERRIAELEAELAAKGEQNLELIKAKIETTRRKLEGERPDDPLNWN